MEYTVSKSGVVNNSKGRVIKSRVGHDGYIRINIMEGNVRVSRQIHRLVALAYIPNPDNLPEVNHKDGDKSNNNDWNLEWCTRSHNVKEAYRLNLRNATGENNACSKLTEKDVLEIRSKYVPKIYHSYMLAKEYNVTQHLIMLIIHRKLWTHI